MKFTVITFLSFLLFFTGCASKSTFQPEWLSEPKQVTYSSEFEGNIRVKLKAKVSESEFAAAVQKLGLIPHADDKEFATNLDALGWKQGPDKRWDPLSDISGTLISHHLNLWETAKYERGFLYYQLIDLDK